MIGEPDDARNLGLVIAETEIPVAVAMTLEIADLAAYPDTSHARFDCLARSLGEIHY